MLDAWWLAVEGEDDLLKLVVLRELPLQVLLRSRQRCRHPLSKCCSCSMDQTMHFPTEAFDLNEHPHLEIQTLAALHWYRRRQTKIVVQRQRGED